jgi:hypothetical protein
MRYMNTLGGRTGETVKLQHFLYLATNVLPTDVGSTFVNIGRHPPFKEN